MVSCQEKYWIGIVTEAAVFQCESLFNGSMYINYMCEGYALPSAFHCLCFFYNSFLYVSFRSKNFSIYLKCTQVRNKERYLDDNNLESRRE